MADDSMHLESFVQRAADHVLAKWTDRDALVMACGVNSEGNKMLYLRDPCYDALLAVLTAVLFGPSGTPEYRAASRLAGDTDELQLQTGKVVRRVLGVVGVTTTG